MIQYLDFHQPQRLLEVARQDLVGVAGLRDAGRMVVREHHGGGVVSERGFHHFARIDTGLRQCAAEKFVGGDEAEAEVSHIKEHAREAMRAANPQHLSDEDLRVQLAGPQVEALAK